MKWLWKTKMVSIEDLGEEEEEGAVYHLTLRKVQIIQPANKGARWLEVDEDQLPPEYTVSHYETFKTRAIKAGTLEKLVENLLTAFGDNDSSYISIFLSTYRSFASTKEVLDLLLDRYGNLEISSCEEQINNNSAETKPELKSAIASILRAWLDQFPEDFDEAADYLCLKKILDYLSRTMPGSDPERKAQYLLEQFQKQEEVNNSELHDTITVEEKWDTSGADFSSFSAYLVAEQLTYMDSELFKKVVPHHCLGCIWSQRNKKGNHNLAPTIRATIAQFNAVTKCVVSTILNNKELKTQQRTKIIEKWINIAYECRILKNFSSLKAIVSALQSNPIYRLKKCWECVSKDIMEVYEELSAMCAENDNYLTSRELLMKEGTSKLANLDSSVEENLRRLNLQKFWGKMQGTIPYLGMFLTDLTMVDTALQDSAEGGLINFEKRRREFEIIAEIKLLQASCKSYQLKVNKDFTSWFKSYTLSCDLEAAASPKPKRVVKRLSHDGDEATSCATTPTENGNKPEEKTEPACSSVTSGAALPPPQANPPHICPVYNRQNGEACVIRVSVKGSEGNIYKSLIVTNQDRTADVIKRAIEKHHIAAEPDEYELAQVLPEGKELVFPETANLYYGMNSRVDFNFILRERPPTLFPGWHPLPHFIF